MCLRRQFFPSELCLDYLGAVNFNKGCYVGQELTARTHFRGVVRKRILPVHISGPSSGHGGGDAQAAIVVPPADGEQAAKEIGKLIAVPGDGDIGVASLRLDPCAPPHCGCKLRQFVSQIKPSQRTPL